MRADLSGCHCAAERAVPAADIRPTPETKKPWIAEAVARRHIPAARGLELRPPSAGTPVIPSHRVCLEVLALVADIPDGELETLGELKSGVGESLQGPERIKRNCQLPRWRRLGDRVR